LSFLLIVSYCRFGIREFAEASFVIKAKEEEKRYRELLMMY
jgi:hypothetical protein